MSRPRRMAVYALLGWGVDFAYNQALAPLRGEPVLEVRTSPWMLPLYGLIQPLFEPAHDALRGRSRLLRGAVYGAGFLGVEYASGRLLRRLRGQAPWDYSHVRFQLHGLTRFDYFPLWALAGLALEHVHDRLA
jgi:hypothetical protein